MAKSGYGPAIRVSPSDEPPAPRPDEEAQFILSCYRDWEMMQLIPRFAAYPTGMRAILPVDTIPNPRDASTTDVQNISLIFETPGSVEPALGFEFYVRGVAAASLIARSEFLSAIKLTLVDIATHVSNGGSLPALDDSYRADISRCEHVIFTNGEHSSWRSMIAFMQGAFWLLGHMQRPTRRRGAFSPVEYINGLVLHYGGLGYIPQ